MNFHHHFSSISNGLRCCKQDPKNTKKLQKNILLLCFWGIHQQHWLSWSGQGCGKVPWKHNRTSNLVKSLDSTSPSSMCHSILRDGPKQGRMPPVLPSGSFIWNEAFSLHERLLWRKKFFTSSHALLPFSLWIPQVGIDCTELPNFWTGPSMIIVLVLPRPRASKSPRLRSTT